MPTFRARRVWPVLVVHLTVLGIGFAATYDRGPLPVLTARIVGRDPQAEARTRAASEAGEAAQRTPANAVRGADGQMRYAVVRFAPPRAESPELRRGRLGTRVTLIVLAVLAVATSARRVRRRRRGEHPQPLDAPNAALPPPWPVAHHGEPLSPPVERGDVRHARAERPRS